MTDRERLAADIASLRAMEHDVTNYDIATADRLIALGWTRLDEERLARALAHADATLRRPSDGSTRRRHRTGKFWFRDYAVHAAKAYREDTDAD